MSTVRFGYTIVYVPDVQRALDFYTNAFGFEQGFVSPDGGYGELMTGETTFRLPPKLWGIPISSMAFCGTRSPIPPSGRNWLS